MTSTISWFGFVGLGSCLQDSAEVSGFFGAASRCDATGSSGSNDFGGCSRVLEEFDSLSCAVGIWCLTVQGAR